MNRLTSSLAAVFLLFQISISAQSYTAPAHSMAEWLTDRYLILGEGESQIHPELKPFSRKDIAGLAVSAFKNAAESNRRDNRNFQYLWNENNEFLPDTLMETEVSESNDPFQSSESATSNLAEIHSFYKKNDHPLFGIFYKTPANFFEVNVPGFRLKVNPMLNVAFGKSQDEKGILFANQRGLEIRGDVDGKAWFYTNVLETQTKFPDYVNGFIKKYNAVPGNGLFKNFDSKLFNTENAYDFANAQANVGFNVSKHIGVELGHGRHNIGNGYRSLFLSDFSNNYFYLKLNTRVWKFHYQNLFMELTPSAFKPATGDSILAKKYAAIHYLNYQITPRLAIGFFEATVFNRSENFELQYLNPVILYRTVEQAIGSPDNVLIGLDWRYNFLKQFQFYGQILLDEFDFNFIFKSKQRGYWGNKNGVQTGLKYINALGIKHLDLQFEFNQVRPYTYSHSDTLNSFTHYRQPLAHPMGANFREIVGILRYQPIHRLTLQGRFLFSKYGEDEAAKNWGASPLLDNEINRQDYDNKISQGIMATQTILAAEMNWQLYHNLFLDFRILMRDKDSKSDGLDLKTSVFGAGIRMNIWNQNLDF